MTLSGHAHSDRQRYDKTACHVTRERALNIARNGEYVSIRRVQPKEWFWIDSNGKKWKEVHSFVVSFGSEFPAICNRWGVMAIWSRKTLKFREKLLRFFIGQTTSYGKIFKMCSEDFSRLTDRRCCVQISCTKLVRREIGELVRYLPDKRKQKFACLSNYCYCRGSRPKSARISPQQCTQSAPDLI